MVVTNIVTNSNSAEYWLISTVFVVSTSGEPARVHEAFTQPRIGGLVMCFLNPPKLAMVLASMDQGPWCGAAGTWPW